MDFSEVVDAIKTALSRCTPRNFRGTVVSLLLVLSTLCPLDNSFMDSYDSHNLCLLCVSTQVPFKNSRRCMISRRSGSSANPAFKFSGLREKTKEVNKVNYNPYLRVLCSRYRLLFKLSLGLFNKSMDGFENCIESCFCHG